MSVFTLRFWMIRLLRKIHLIFYLLTNLIYLIMKEIKLSFPYPATSRHNLSQDISTSLSMGVLVPVRTVEVLPGDSHRIQTSFSLISNPLVKPLLQGVRMRYCRFWVPRRIYHPDQRSNNTNFDPRTASVRCGQMRSISWPLKNTIPSDQPNEHDFEYMSPFQSSSFYDYFGWGNYFLNFYIDPTNAPAISESQEITSRLPYHLLQFNAEPYIAYIDIVRNYFADSATGTVAWVTRATVPGGQSYNGLLNRHVCVSPLSAVDRYIDEIQNADDHSLILPYSPTSYTSTDKFVPFILDGRDYIQYSTTRSMPTPEGFDTGAFGYSFQLSHVGLCVPSNRPDRLSRLFDTRPLVSQNATVDSSEITISNLSFLAKLQRYLTRRFFGGSRYTDIMYSVFGQKVPHVDSPVTLDVFDYELGSELVASTNATETQNPGVTGGFFASSGVLKSGRGSSRKRYTFNESGYLIDCVYIMPRLSRAAFVSDFYPVDTNRHMLQANFIPDFNGIGWQQPAFAGQVLGISWSNSTSDPVLSIKNNVGFCSEPSWQQYRTLPDICSGVLNPTRSIPAIDGQHDLLPVNVNSPYYIFTDRLGGYTFHAMQNTGLYLKDSLLASLLYFPYTHFNDVFGARSSDIDNIFVTFSYAHQAKRQVTKRFTLNFN